MRLGGRECRNVSLVLNIEVGFAVQGEQGSVEGESVCNLRSLVAKLTNNARRVDESKGELGE